MSAKIKVLVLLASMILCQSIVVSAEEDPLDFYRNNGMGGFVDGWGDNNSGSIGASTDLYSQGIDTNIDLDAGDPLAFYTQNGMPEFVTRETDLAADITQGLEAQGIDISADLATDISQDLAAKGFDISTDFSSGESLLDKYPATF